MIAIWVDDWQLGDEGFRVAVGDHLDWIVVDDAVERVRSWTGGRAIDHVMDPHELMGVPSFVRRVRGKVHGVESMRVRHDRDGEAVAGSQRFEAIRSTGEQSWGMCEEHRVAGFVILVATTSLDDAPDWADRSPWFEGAQAPEHDWASDPPAPDWSAIPAPTLPPLPAGQTYGTFFSRDEPPRPDLWCRHPAHRV